MKSVCIRIHAVVISHYLVVGTKLKLKTLNQWNRCNHAMSQNDIQTLTNISCSLNTKILPAFTKIQ